jgi:hypothetical protein
VSAWIFHERSRASGENGSTDTASRDLKTSLGGGDPPLFPPQIVWEVKALACALPAETGRPLSRWSREELKREVLRQGIVAQISGTTIWRWLDADAIRPWSHRSWIFPRDPRFAEKAGPVLDLYHREWEGEPLGDDDFVISADEKTQLQLRERRHPSTPPAPNRPIRVEHEYRRHGTCAYQAALDVHHARLFGHVVGRSTANEFDRLIAEIMQQPPYATARRVFLIVDNGAIHRGRASIGRLEGQWKNLRVIHLPIHASWLNQIEIYFSIVQRKAWMPDDCSSIEAAEARIMGFQRHYQAVARPFEWKFTREDLTNLLSKLTTSIPTQRAAA